MPTYYAISTENAQMCGWTILAAADTRDKARGMGYDSIEGHDIHADTWRKNLRVVPETEAKRKYHLSNRIGDWWERWHVRQDGLRTATERAGAAQR